MLVFIIWYSENFAYLIKQFLSYSPIQFVFFLKSRLFFNIFCCFWMFVNKHFANFTVTRVYFRVYYFYMNRNWQENFHICISVPLSHNFGVPKTSHVENLWQKVSIFGFDADFMKSTCSSTKHYTFSYISWTVSLCKRSDNLAIAKSGEWQLNKTYL